MKNENQKKMNKNIGKISIVLFTLTMAMMAIGNGAFRICHTCRSRHVRNELDA